jgi:KaiC domain protein
VIAVSDGAENEDWFERALEDDSADAGSDGVDGAGSDDAPAASEPAPTGESEDAPAGEDDDAPGEEDAEDEAGLFEQDFAAALDSAPEGLGDEGGEIDMSGELDVDDGGEFDMGGGGEFGVGGEFGGLGGTESFDEEDLDTDIDRIDLGIDGLDDMIQGGVPERSLMVAIGSAGTGKTTFGLQFLDEELRDDGGNAVFITLEESRDRIIKSATEKGYPFDEYVEEGRLAIVDLDPIDMANSLATIRSELPRLIGEFDARRLVLDSVSLLEMMYDSRATRRNEIYDFTKSLKQSGVTTMLTSEASSDSPYNSRYGIVEYLTDAVFVLQYVRPSDFRKTRLAVEIQKIRDANHSRETKPYEITSEGISVYQQANIF